ncbi:hypothetical protein Cgig2_017184 [Carnegiea gigantea]|uniref:Uncharacterized protein n=1 Tax=Carnegiea gigantea TaxID=171969 RepID=A0A9Q1QAZ1_9CARY|nr:hypothetical protein Cgig2_017184 [Carnegiea gigantea]
MKEAAVYLLKITPACSLDSTPKLQATNPSCQEHAAKLPNLQFIFRNFFFFVSVTPACSLDSTPELQATNPSCQEHAAKLPNWQFIFRNFFFFVSVTPACSLDSTPELQATNPSCQEHAAKLPNLQFIFRNFFFFVSACHLEPFQGAYNEQDLPVSVRWHCSRAKNYGSCVASKIPEVERDMCLKEFCALKNCMKNVVLEDARFPFQVPALFQGFL